MILFDLTLLTVSSIVLATKNLYLGSATLVIGLLIVFQSVRTVRLLGSAEVSVSNTRKIKAAVLAVIIGLSVCPLLITSDAHAIAIDQDWSDVTLLPIAITVGLLASVAMAALAIEKRKR